MLRKLVVLATACFCLAAANFGIPQTADKTFVVRQKDLHELFWYVNQPTVVYSQLHLKARSFNIESTVDFYNDKVAVHDFLQRFKHGLLPRGEIFSVMLDDHREEMLSLFRLFYHAKDYDTFYNTAVWARFNVNEMMYAYALAVAVIHRPDTRYIRVPPFYEISPQLFFNNDVIQQAHYVKMMRNSDFGSIDQHIINANYTGWYITSDDDDDQKLNYFTEDIGLNNYYFYFRHVFPFWMTSTEFNLPKNIRGESYYYGHKQLLTRYYLERLSNDLGEIEYFDWDRPFIPGYHPALVYSNGHPMPERNHWSMIPLDKLKYLQMVDHMEDAVGFATNLGYVVTPNHKYLDIDTVEGFDHLGNIIEGNADSLNENLYGSLDRIYREILGWSVTPTAKHQVVPSALQMFSTSMRDPAFYRIYKRILTYFATYKEKHHQAYTHAELAFPGVKIESITVDKLVTFFDYFDTLLNNAVGVQSQKDVDSFYIKARQNRLNHKPFTYHMTVTSDKIVDATVRIFLGPKYDVHNHELDISENYMNFFQLDQWIVKLTVGANKIERNSQDFVLFTPDEPSSEIPYEKMIKAIDGSETYVYYNKLTTMPERLILPKGKKEGMVFKLFAFISHFDDEHAKKYDSPVWGPFTVDDKAWGFPLDRPVHSYNFTVPNMYVKDVVIYHKEMEELNLTV